MFSNEDVNSKKKVVDVDTIIHLTTVSGRETINQCSEENKIKISRMSHFKENTLCYPLV